MPDTLASPVATRQALQGSWWATGLFFLALLLVFHETTWSMVSIWLRSDTFAHGFLILPISLWLVWNQRDHWRFINPKPAMWVALLMVPPGFVWLLAWLVDVLVVQQLALVTMLILGAWAIMGHQLARVLAFPLLFLFFAVPMGEALVPYMMEFTATSTVWLIQQTGIPVYREGLFFYLPSGNWSVVEACSGVRYIIASVTLGVLYAYLTYRSVWRRALFILVSAIVPVFANTARAYIIVMLGHLSDMTVATGVDHLIYGWFFFGLVVFLLFWLGSFWREDDPDTDTAHSPKPEQKSSGKISRGSVRMAAMVALLAAIVWPLLAITLEARSESRIQFGMTLPAAGGTWQNTGPVEWRWQPYSSVAGQISGYYERNGNTVGLFIQYPERSGSDEDIIGSSSRFIVTDSDWRVAGRSEVTLDLGQSVVLVDQAVVKGLRQKFLALSWYRIGSFYTSNDYLAKLREAMVRLGLVKGDSYRIVLAVPMGEKVEPAQAVLRDFLYQHSVSLETLLDETAIGSK